MIYVLHMQIIYTENYTAQTNTSLERREMAEDIRCNNSLSRMINAASCCDYVFKHALGKKDKLAEETCMLCVHGTHADDVV